MKNITSNDKTEKQYILYKEKYESSCKQSEQLAVTSGRISFLRMAAFAMAGVLLFLGYRQNSPALFALAAGSWAAFFMLVRYHGRLTEEQAYQRDAQSVFGDYMARFGDDWKNFPLDGERYLRDDFLEAGDLDLFGKGSLYQFICTAGTIRGQDRLALWLGLSGKDFAKDDVLQASREIGSRQQAVAELAGKPEFCMELETRARRLRGIEYEKSVEIMDTFFRALKTKNNTPVVFRICVWLFPVFTLASLFLSLFGFYRQLAMPLFFLLAFAQLMAVFLGLYRNNRVLSPVYRMNRAVTAYRELFQLLEQESFESPYLVDLQGTMLRDGASASLKELEAISDSVCARHNVYAFLLYNSLFLHDYHCVMRFEAWKDTYRDKLEAWFQALGDVEALISLGVVCHTRRVHCLPELADCGHPVLTAADLRHPLLKETLAVGNDVELTRRVCIITGSNMSGKTTFMRSIGINLALAYAGGFCTAGSLQVSLMKLCTSIRTEDNVHEGISTFYAELLRVKRMIEASEKQIPMISLIDEIYKGTNSKDRIFAAKETIRKLSKPWSFTLLTTHDFELCDLEHDTETDAGNYYFTEYYEDNQICFDYKLRDGRCTTTNARYLLRMAGIIQ